MISDVGVHNKSPSLLFIIAIASSPSIHERMLACIYAIAQFRLEKKMRNATNNECTSHVVLDLTR